MKKTDITDGDILAMGLGRAGRGVSYTRITRVEVVKVHGERTFEKPVTRWNSDTHRYDKTGETTTITQKGILVRLLDGYGQYEAGKEIILENARALVGPWEQVKAEYDFDERAKAHQQEWRQAEDERKQRNLVRLRKLLELVHYDGDVLIDVQRNYRGDVTDANTLVMNLPGPNSLTQVIAAALQEPQPDEVDEALAIIAGFEFDAIPYEPLVAEDVTA